MTLIISPWSIQGLPELQVGDIIKFTPNNWEDIQAQVLYILNDGYMIIVSTLDGAKTSFSYHHVTAIYRDRWISKGTYPLGDPFFGRTFPCLTF